MTTLILLTSLSACAGEVGDFYATLSCPALDTIYTQKTYKQTRHVEWMSEHCSGEREFTVPACKSMSSLLLEELSEIGELERVLNRKCGGVDEP